MEVESPTLGFLLHEVARLLRKRFEQISRESGLTRSQWQALAYLAQNEGINQSGLAELLDIEPITLSRILDKLEACGLIERHPHSSDRRVRILRLAPAARPKLMQARKLGEIARREALTGLSEAEGLRLLETLKVLKCNLAEACDFGRKAEASNSWVVPAKQIPNDTVPTAKGPSPVVIHQAPRTRSIV